MTARVEPASHARRSPEFSQAVLLIATLSRTLLSLVLTMMLGRALAASEFGFFALVGSVFGLAHEFTDMGSGNVAVRDIAQHPKSERAMLEQLLGLRVALSLIAAAACAVLALFQDTRAEELILIATAVILGFSYLSAFSTVFLMRQAQVGPSLLQVLAQLGTLAACGALLGLKVAGVAFALTVLAREIGILAGTQRLAVRLLGYTPQPQFDRAALRPFFGKAAIVALGTLFYHFQFQGGMFFVEFLRPADELGAFAAAFRPLTPFLFLPWLLMLPLVPFLSWLAAHRRDDFRRQVRGILHLAIGVGAVAAAASFRLAPPLMALLYGDKFSHGALSAIDALRWLSVALAGAFVAAAISTALLADNRENQILKLSTICLGFYVIANIVLVPRLGFDGAAVATSLAAAAMTLGGLAILRGFSGAGPDWGVLAMPLPAAVLFAALHFVSGPIFVQLAIGAVLSLAMLAAVFSLPGVAPYRAEQRRLAKLVPAGAGSALPADCDG
jgi:O-antigen/teichoic acid export membrane protein